MEESDEENEDNDEIPKNDDDDDENEISTDYFSPNTVCAVAAGQESNEMFYFIFNEDFQVADFDVMDDFNHLVVKGQTYLSGFYLEKKAETSKGVTYTINKNKTVYFYPESLVYPFVNFQEDYKGKKNTMFISNEDYCEVLCFIEKSKMSKIV